MTVTNASTLDAYAQIAQQTYLQDPPFDVGPTDPVASSNGTYVEIDNPSLQVPQIDGPLGFQARAFFNHTNNELVIAFTGTEGFSDVNAPEFLPDFIADFGLAVAGVSPQDAAAQAFVQQATLAAQAQVGIFGSFDVTYVGHSLGGFLAQTASAAAVAAGGVAQEGEVVVFNSPGAGGFLNLPNSDIFPEENYTYIYSDPDEWGLFPGAIHSVGDTLSDNIFYVPASAGHALTTTATPSLALGDVLNDGTVLVAAGDEIFLPVDQAIQILGAPILLDSYDDGDGASIINGTGSDDTLNGGTGDDVVIGFGGDDVLDGLSGNDTLEGGSGDDVLYGSDGDDNLGGWSGDDTLYGGDGDDYLNGGSGADDLFGGSGNDQLEGGKDADYLIGGADDDVLNGWAGDDVLLGDTGDDTINGGGGNDSIRGNAGFDTIVGGGGNDTLSGGVNWDVFVFEGVFGNDTITDFNVTNLNEAIDLSGVTTIDDFADLAANHLNQSGADAVIADGNGNTITLLGVDMTDLSANDFLF